MARSGACLCCTTREASLATVEMIAREYPDVAFIIPHLSSFADDWRAQLGFIDQLVRHPNIHTDTSGVRSFDLLVDAVRRAGPSKVLWGSDGPFLHPAAELAKVKALRLERSAEDLVLSGNFLRLVRGVRRRRRTAGAVAARGRGAGR